MNTLDPVLQARIGFAHLSGAGAAATEVTPDMSFSLNMRFDECLRLY
jgi:hypothetical protein